MLLLVKVFLAFCALALAVSSIGFNTLDKDLSGPWYRRIRIPGFVALAAAIGVFGFGVANEVLSYRSSQEAERLLNDEIRALRLESADAAGSLAAARAQLDAAEDQVGFSVAIGRDLQARLELARTVSGGSLARVAVHDIALHELPRPSIPEASVEAPLPIALWAGDEIEWSLACHGSRPEPADHVGSVTFCGENYGRFVAASANPVLVSGASGRSGVPANVQHGSTLYYQPPYGRTCGPLHDAMRASMCVLQVRVYRELRHVLEDTLRSVEPEGLPIGPLPAHLCTLYRELYEGRDCSNPRWGPL